MIRYLANESKEFIFEIINKLKGSHKRIALAKASKLIGKGGQTIVAKKLGVSRNTIRKGVRELKSGDTIVDNYSDRGRKNIEEKLPNILDDIKDIIDSQSQTDPSFRTVKLYTRITSKEVRKQLILQKNYNDKELPTVQTINNKINTLGYTLRKVRKAKPLKKIKETDDIFENVKKINKENENKDNVVRISMDTKDRVKIGDFSRGGYTRCFIQGADHDFSKHFIVPFGILNLDTDQVDVVFTEYKATADFMVDAIEEFWIKYGYNLTKDTLVINADNGPENSSRRTQFMKRIIEFSVKYKVKIILAYYPPYHSKYNPIERVWGALEQHWNAAILDSRDTVLKFASSMTWKGKTPRIRLENKIYETGVKVSKDIMNLYESMIDRSKTIGKWFVTISYEKCKEVIDMEIKT